jgi:hypothetical protein
MPLGGSGGSTLSPNTRFDETVPHALKSTRYPRLIHLLREGGYMPLSPRSPSALPRS